jgi:hypothetical protein
MVLDDVQLSTSSLSSLYILCLLPPVVSKGQFKDATTLGRIAIVISEQHSKSKIVIDV